MSGPGHQTSRLPSFFPHELYHNKDLLHNGSLGSRDHHGPRGQPDQAHPLRCLQGAGSHALRPRGRSRKEGLPGCKGTIYPIISPPLTPWPHADSSLTHQYAHYLPTWNPEQKYPPLQPFEHYEHGKDADTTFPNLLPKATSKVVHLTPTIGTEVSGIQLSALTDAGKDELARFVAERKVVAFRGQDFADLPIEKALEFGAYFGRHHIHPTSGSPEGFPEIHLVHRGAGDRSAEEFFASRTSSVAWHSDVSYEQQPPGTTFLYILDKPETGGIRCLSMLSRRITGLARFLRRGCMG